jgi:tetratricopeptide (TPR) repeat protein
MRSRLFLAMLVLCGVCGAQVIMDQQMQMSRPGQADEPNKPKPTADQLRRGRQMLETAEASANGMEGGMRAYALLQVASAYSSTDKKKALELLDNALAVTKGMEDDQTQVRNRLQEQILQAIVPLKPQKADELLNQVDPSARGRVLNSLLGYYQKNNDWDRAIEVVYRIAPEQEVPYDAVMRIIHGLPEDRAGDRNQLFSTALTSFKNHPTQRGRVQIGGSDFASLIQTSWKMLPRETVLDAIHAVLEKTRQQSQDSSGGPQPMSIAMSSANGGVAFNSMYEFRLFQLLPVLKQIDSSEAEKLVKENQTLRNLAEQYPDGMNSIAPPQSSTGNGQSGGLSSNMTMSVGGPGGGSGSGSGRGAAPNMPSPMMMQQVMKIVQDSAKHPEDALANAAAVSDKNLRVQAYMGIAQTNAKANASAAKQALEKVMDGIGDLDPIQQATTVSSVAKMYMDLEDTATAKKVIEKGMGIAEKAYKVDTNADDPNKALKAYWPSAEAYRSMLRLAAKISAPWAMELLKDISDPEMKGMGQIALAQSWLDLPTGPRTIMNSNKNGTSMQMSRDQ